MQISFWLLVVIVIIVLGVILIFLSASKGMSDFLAPNKESDSTAAVKIFLNFDFGNDYKVIEHISQNFHPDQPLKISVKLHDNAIDNTKSFLNGLSLETKVSVSDDNKTKYIQIWRRDGNLFQKTHTAYHLNSDGTEYMFFSAELKIDLDSMLITFNETGF